MPLYIVRFPLEMHRISEPRTHPTFLTFSSSSSHPRTRLDDRQLMDLGEEDQVYRKWQTVDNHGCLRSKAS